MTIIKLVTGFVPRVMSNDVMKDLRGCLMKDLRASSHYNVVLPLVA